MFSASFSYRSFALYFLLLVVGLVRGSRALADETPLLNPSFEQGEKAPDHWMTTGDVTVDETEKVEGARSLHLNRDPVNLPVTQALSDKFKVTPGVWEFAGAMKGDLYSPDVSFNASVKVWLYDATGKELVRRNVTFLAGKSGWKKFREHFEVPPDAASALVAIEFNKTHGDLSVDDFSVKYAGKSIPMEGGERKTVFHCDRVGFLFYPGDDVKVTMSVETPVALAGDRLNFPWELTDFWSELQVPVQKGKLTADGKAANGWNRYTATLDLTGIVLKPGPYYEIHTFVNLGAAALAKDRMSFAILPEAATRGYDPMEIPFGAHTWNATVYDYFPLSARLGLRRCLVFWNWPKDPPHTPAFDSGYQYDCRLGWPKRFGMAPYGVLYPVTDIEHKSNEAGGARSEEDLRAGIRQSIEKYKKDGLWGFQIGNEPPSANPEMVKKDVETYKIIYDEIKKTDPTIFAIGSAIGPNEEFFKAGFQPYQDAYNIHVYNDLGELRKSMKRYRELFDKYGGKKPIWATEIGSNSQGLTRDVIAKDVIRKVVCFMADGGEFFTWFATGGMPDPTGERSKSGYSDSMDLFDSRYNMFLPRLDAVAYYHIVNAICIKKFVKEIDYPNGVEGYLFRDKNSNCLLVFWNTKGAGDFFLALSDVYGVDVTHYDGRETRLDAAGKGINLRIGDEPVMLAFRGGEDTIPAELKPAGISISGLPDEFIQGKASQIAIRVRMDKEHNIAATFTGPPLWKIMSQGGNIIHDGEEIDSWNVTPPEDTKASMATFKFTAPPTAYAGGTELLFSIPVKSKVEVNLEPMGADLGEKPGKATMRLILTNHSDKEQAVKWNAELVNESPMENGTYDFKKSNPPSAFFARDARDKVVLKPHEVKDIPLEIDNVDRLTIYKIRATAFDSNGTPVTRERLVSGFAKVAHAKGKITIDGTLDEADWKNAPKCDINEARQFFMIDKDAKPWGGVNDLSGSIRFLWDDQFLYLGAEVTDDIFRNTHQDEDIWRGDSLQFLINPYRQEPGGKGRYDYAMGTGAKGDQVSCHLSADPIGAPAGLVTDIKLVTKHTDPANGNITYEIAIPWSRLAPFKPASAADLGLAVILNEDDGIARKSFMGWFSGVHLKETDFVGDLILEK